MDAFVHADLVLTRGIVAASGLYLDVTLNWVDVAIDTTPGITKDQADGYRGEVFKYHRKVSLRHATHLQPACEHLDAGMWMFAQIWLATP